MAGGLNVNAVKWYCAYFLSIVACECSSLLCGVLLAVHDRQYQRLHPDS